MENRSRYPQGQDEWWRDPQGCVLPGERSNPRPVEEKPEVIVYGHNQMFKVEKGMSPEEELDHILDHPEEGIDYHSDPQGLNP